MMGLCLGIAYLLGSIPFGLLAGFLAGTDVRKHGSGNIGFTNVLRVCGARWGVPVLILDILKGTAPVLWITPALMPGAGTLVLVLTGFAAILGHSFPVWLGFRGGKGVATSAGVVAVLMGQAFLVALATWLVVVAASRIISLGSILAGVALVAGHVAILWARGESPWAPEIWPLTATAIALCLLVIVRHRSNIQRLLAGTESRIGAKPEAAKDESAPAPQSPDAPA